MLEHTFCHVRGIGLKTERRLWQSGCGTWGSLAGVDDLPVGGGKVDALRAGVTESIGRLAASDARYFARRLPPDQSWRLFPHFRASAAYLDIETTGLGHDDHVTTIALYDGCHVHTYVHGRNLDDFPRDVEQYRLLVTYNGKSFDLPFLRDTLRLHLTHAHIDLRYVLARLGYTGGLKGCERTLGLDRGDLADLDGYFAVLLWQEFKRGRNERVLDTLLAYNALDVLNLESLMVLAYNAMSGKTPFGAALQLPPCTPAPLPFTPDHDLVARIKRKYAWHFGR